MFKSIRSAMADQYRTGRESVLDLIAYLRRTEPPSDVKFGLASRELEIVAMVVAGYTNKDIARRFILSEEMVKDLLSGIFDKLGVSNRLEAALVAVKHHLLEEEEPTR